MPDFDIYMEETVNSRQKKWFRERLMDWDSTENQREMPWKGEKNPYRVWMSEIILQQTRVEQGTAYYERFVKEYPDPAALANAPEENVFKMWEGLGYYSRCKNMISAAKEIQVKYGGNFPGDYSKILSLPGVGAYTAAAIASFAFGHPYAVLDGNVFRVLSRFFGMSEPIDGSPGKKVFSKLADTLLDTAQPARYNQAIMDLGAIVCKPRKPDCESCPLNKNCVAYVNELTSFLPVKSKKLVKKTRWLNFLLVVNGSMVVVEKRGAGDIWENLYQFPVVESEKIPQLEEWDVNKYIGRLKNAAPDFILQQSQQLTHQTIHGRFFVLQVENVNGKEDGGWVEGHDLKKLPFPRMIGKVLPDLSAYFT